MGRRKALPAAAFEALLGRSKLASSRGTILRRPRRRSRTCSAESTLERHQPASDQLLLLPEGGTHNRGPSLQEQQGRVLHEPYSVQRAAAERQRAHHRCRCALLLLESNRLQRTLQV